MTHTEIKESIDILERKHARINQINHLLIPDVLPLDKHTERALKKINPDNIYQNSNTKISKNDLMFLFWLHHTGTIEHALLGYLKSGLEQADSMRILLMKIGFDLNTVKTLDFASGHGRVSRYFKNYLPIENIYISDIKINAVEFQSNNFNYQGFLATSNPSLLNIPMKFDFIIVSSLFTHLNRKLFGDWINTLGNLLKENGVLSFSIHLISTHEPLFTYAERSEEDLFPETEDSLSGQNIYGLTQISLESLNSLLSENLKFNFDIIDQRGWGDSQTLISLRKK